MADFVGVSEAIYYKYEQDKAKPSGENLGMIVTKTGCNLIWLLFGAGRPFGSNAGVSEHELRYGQPEPIIMVLGPQDRGIQDDIEAEARACVAVPILGGAIAAGVPRDVFEEEVEGWAICYRDAVLHPHQTSCVRVEGDSMEPCIPDGSLVGIDHAERDPRRLTGAFVALRHDDGCVIRRLIQAHGHWLGMPANHTDENRPVVFGHEDHQENPIVGKVIFSFAVFR